MIREYNGILWYCCPRCGQKLHMIQPGAECHGVLCRCKGVLPDGKKCGWVGEMIIKKEA